MTPTQPLVVRATLTTRFIDDIEFVNDSVPVGKVYFVDLATKQVVHWLHEGTRQRDLLCVEDVMHGGFLPLEILSIE